MGISINSLLNQALTSGNGRQVDGIISLPSRHKTDPRPASSAGAAKGDSLALSEPLKALKELGVDLKNSTISEATQRFNFNFQFTDEHVSSVSANGSYDLHAQSLQVDFSFYSALTIKDPETGTERKDLFRFDFHLEASQLQTAGSEQRVEKEDVLQFAHRILGAVSTLHADGKSVDGLVLDNEDLKDLASVDGGKLLKSIMLIIDLLRNSDRMLGKNADHFLLKPERGSSLITEGQQQEQQSFTMSLSVQRISSESMQTSVAVAPQAGEASAQESAVQEAAVQ